MADRVRYLIQIIFSSIGFIGCFINIGIFIKFRESKGFAFELVLYLTISCIISNIAYLMYNDSSEKSQALCVIQGTLVLCFETSQYIWTTIISYSIYKNVLYSSNNDESEKKNMKKERIIYLSIAFGLPIAITIIAGSLLNFSPMPHLTYCWLKTDSIYSTILLAFFLAMRWIMMIISIYFIVRTILFLRKNYNDEVEKEIVKTYINRLAWYPVMQFIYLFPPTLEYIMDKANINYNIFAFSIFRIAVLSLSGIIYALVYGFSKRILNQIKEDYFNCLCCKHPSGSEGNLISDYNKESRDTSLKEYKDQK